VKFGLTTAGASYAKFPTITQPTFCNRDLDGHVADFRSFTTPARL
jgi:hypothetical protein